MDSRRAVGSCRTSTRAFIRQTAAWLGEADALLLGRRTYDSFARDWPEITDPDDPFTGLIDELRLVIAPVVVGNGRRLFPDGGAPAGLRLVSNDSTPGGLAIQVYESIGLPRYGTYEGSTELP